MIPDASLLPEYKDQLKGKIVAIGGQYNPQSGVRSEEHTSELQSHSDLVCRLLLEKKKEEKKKKKKNTHGDEL